jgi:putative peptidoglycan lipid II flippase
LAQKASPWAAGVIGYAERLMDLPLGVIGVAFGTVLLPTFSGFFARGDSEGAKKAFSSSVTNMMMLMMPAAAGLFVLADEVTAVIYEGNAFDSVATARVARALAVYALGLAFFGYQKSIVPWFQAQKDVKTPLRVAVKMVFLNAFLNILAVATLPVEWRHAGLAASTVLCAAVGAVMLTLIARRRNGSLGLGGECSRILRIAVSTAVMAAALYFLKALIGAAMNRYAALALMIAAGGALYMASVFALGLRFSRGVR